MDPATITCNTRLFVRVGSAVYSGEAGVLRAEAEEGDEGIGNGRRVVGPDRCDAM